jgi:predicted alpha/beta-hydrolase family hydrolase
LSTKRFEREGIRGWLHQPQSPGGDGLALTHGAGSNCEAPLLKALAEAFAEVGVWVLRFDLPYRQQRPKGPPFPAQAARDREGEKLAVQALREFAPRRVFLSGSSYGGRQATMLLSEDPVVADGLLLLSYPLHPPGKPLALRTAHFPNLRAPAMFVHGTRDSFGSVPELTAAVSAIPARTEIVAVEGAPHGLPASVSRIVPAAFLKFMTA